MKRKTVYLLQEGFETAENKWGIIVPCGTDKSPIFYYVFDEYFPVYDEENQILYYPIVEALVGHDEKRWDFFSIFRAEKDIDKYKFCYIVDLGGESFVLLKKEDVKFEFINLQDYYNLFNNTSTGN